MEPQRRVLGRIGARELTPTETGIVNGGIHTLTACSIPGSGAHDDNNIPGDC